MENHGKVFLHPVDEVQEILLRVSRSCNPIHNLPDDEGTVGYREKAKKRGGTRVTKTHA